MGRRAWGWKAVGDRRGPRRSLSSCTHEVAKTGEKKGEFITAKTPFSLFFFFLSPKALSMPWVAVPILCSRLPAKLRKSLPQ
jgi:hypothetical protein